MFTSGGDELILKLTIVLKKLGGPSDAVQTKMRIIFSNHPLRVAMRALASLLCAATALRLLRPSPAAAYSYFTEEALFASFFPGETPSAQAWTPTAEQIDAFKAKVGYKPPSKSYIWHSGHSADGAEAYALIDEQLGQHEPITFGVLLREDGSIERLEVMVYREAYGDGVRSEGFRGQFHRLSFENPMRPGREIQIVSGATISSRALATGARRASALVATWQGR
jgi:hypothetical protein